MKQRYTIKLILVSCLALLSFSNAIAQTLSEVQLGEEANVPKRESRAVWVTTLGGLDWPKNSAYTAEGRERQKAELCHLLDQLKAININTVLLQTRVRGSVIYPSAIEPWDVALTGHYNTNPGYDPLAFAIEECHKRGMELHAWVVTIPAYKIAQAKAMGKTGIHIQKANLIRKHNEQFYLDPGMPETATYLTNICREIVENYDVDGIHFDYIRYPENAASFPDGPTYKKYGNGQPKAQWRRDNITRIVRQIYEMVKSVKPWVRMTCSPVGKSHDLARYPSKGWNCRDAVFQDAQGWLQQGIQDGLYPMMYFKGNHFFPFAADWREQDNGRPVAPGLGIYFLSPSEKNWPLSDVTNQLQYTRQQGLGGQAYFRSKFLTDNTKGLYDYLKTNFYAFPALTPAATWLDSVPPTSPTDFKEELTADGMTCLSWAPSTDNITKGGVRYNVYASTTWPVDTRRAENMVAVALPAPSYSYNAQLAKMHGLHFVVTAMDRFGNESQAAGIEGVNPAVTDQQTGGEDFIVPDEKVVMPDARGNLVLPARNAEFYAVTDLQGRILQTGRYGTTINVHSLPAGWYQVRTLEKKGMSRRILEFWKSKK